MGWFVFAIGGGGVVASQGGARRKVKPRRSNGQAGRAVLGVFARVEHRHQRAGGGHSTGTRQFTRLLVVGLKG